MTAPTSIGPAWYEPSTGKLTTPPGTVGSPAAYLPMPGLGFPATGDIRMMRSNDSAGLPAANQAVYLRCTEGGVVTKVGLSVVTSSGNISVAVYRNSGVGRAAAPGTLLATSGAVACPTAGYSKITLGAQATMAAGDWLAISADNAVAKFRSGLAGQVNDGLGAGVQALQAAAHPLPANPAGLVASIGVPIILVGEPS